MNSPAYVIPKERRSTGQEIHRIVVVGGGAGGLELVTQLGDSLGRSKKAQIILVDKSATHIWKPLLHEVAAGSMDPSAHQLEYVAQARWHNFEFYQGAMMDVSRDEKCLRVAPVLDENQNPILPERVIPYDTLVLAIGSVTNFFNVPGAEKHAMAVDTVIQAETIRRRILSACMRSQSGAFLSADAPVKKVHLVIIGGGATGVELAAELRNTAEVLAAYGLHKLDPQKDVQITLVEVGPRILPPLPEKISIETTRLLGYLNIDVMTGDRVTQVTPDAVLTASGKSLPSDLTVWAGGIRVPAVLHEMGLETNGIGQIIVSNTLQSVSDKNIFAFGDCAACAWGDSGKIVPPRAQAAHQQASTLVKSMHRLLAKKSLPVFTYRDYGSLISLGNYEAVGNLMGRMVGRSVKIQGFLARMLYLSLYRNHQMALHGFFRMAVDALVDWLRHNTKPRVKLH